MTEPYRLRTFVRLSPLMRSAMDGLLTKKLYASKAEIVRAGILKILVEHCPELVNVCKEDDNHES